MVSTTIIWGGAAAVAAIAAYLVIQSAQQARIVELLRPRDNRIKILQVDNETDLGLRCKPSEGSVHVFIKAGRSWVVEGRRRLIKFFGAETTAYTTVIKDSVEQKVSFTEYLRLLWGDKFFDSVPEKQQKLLQDSVFGITVEPTRINAAEHDLDALTSDDVDNQSDNIILKKIAKDQGSKTSPLYTGGLGAIIGALVMYFLMTRGIV